MPVPRPAITQPPPAGTVRGISTQNVMGKQGIAPLMSRGFPGSGASGDTRRITSELLGTEVIEGVAAEVRRTTTTWAVGSVGNDREIVATKETWFSRELGVVMLMKTSDPRSGDTTTKLTDISRVEPNPALFMPPVDYTIKDVGAPAAP
jgi:hypothetical protein